MSLALPSIKVVATATVGAINTHLLWTESGVDSRLPRFNDQSLARVVGVDSKPMSRILMSMIPETIAGIAIGDATFAEGTEILDVWRSLDVLPCESEYFFSFLYLFFC